MADGWSVEFRPSALRELRQLEDNANAEALQVIQELSEDPFPQDAVGLRGHPGVYRIRCCRDAYRIVYSVSRKKRKVIVQRVRPRQSAYQGL
jgi:mRNA-degrading endonuclease RelE of RelBE toxin-antitoxin system